MNTQSMDRETVDRVEALGTGKLLLGLAGPGNPAYQHVYRAGAGVSWDPTRRGFKSTPMQGRPAPWWFSHILAVVRNELNVELQLGHDVAWRNLSDADQDEIRRLR